MKFVRYDHGRTGFVVAIGDNMMIVDVAASVTALTPAATKAIDNVLLPDGSWVAMIGNWDAVGDAFRDMEAMAVRAAVGVIQTGLDFTRLSPPLAAPTSHLFGAGSNTVEHVQHAFKVMKDLDMTVDEVMAPKSKGIPPNGFTIWPDTVVGPEAAVTPPSGFAKLDYEAECAVYVKRGGRGLEPFTIWGHTAWNDFGIRDPHLGLSKEAPWIPYSLNLPKNFDSGNACGPWAVVDEGHNVDALRCQCTVNGEPRQDWNTADMIYTFNDILLHIASYQALRPGDMVTSGTGPGVAIDGGIDGPHWLQPNDVVEIVVEGVGPLKNIIGRW